MPHTQARRQLADCPDSIGIGEITTRWESDGILSACPMRFLLRNDAIGRTVGAAIAAVPNQTQMRDGDEC
jgi:hypothetical protein